MSASLDIRSSGIQLKQLGFPKCARLDSFPPLFHAVPPSYSMGKGGVTSAAQRVVEAVTASIVSLDRLPPISRLDELRSGVHLEDEER